MELRGRNALITGAAHRVGRAIALRLAQEGCNIALHCHTAVQESTETLGDIERLSVKAHSYQADLRSHQEIRKLFASIEKDFQQLDILINSAAIMHRKPFKDAGPDDWDATMDLNLRAAFFCTQSAVRMMDPSDGVVINISDIAGLQPWVDFPVHSISKAGVEMLTKLAALAYAPGIRVNAVAPGPVLKPDHMTEERWDEIGNTLPLGTPGEASDVTEAILFLIKNDFITGETLVVDGGNQLI